MERSIQVSGTVRLQRLVTARKSLRKGHGTPGECQTVRSCSITVIRERVMQPTFDVQGLIVVLLLAVLGGFFGLRAIIDHSLDSLSFSF